MSDEDNNTRLIGKPYRNGFGRFGQARECLECHEWFGSNAAFLMHKVSDGHGGKRCLTVDELEHHTQMHLSGGAMWRTGPDARTMGNVGLMDSAANRPRRDSTTRDQGKTAGSAGTADDGSAEA